MDGLADCEIGRRGIKARSINDRSSNGLMGVPLESGEEWYIMTDGKASDAMPGDHVPPEGPRSEGKDALSLS